MNKKDGYAIVLDNICKNYKVKLTENGALNIIKGIVKPQYKSIEAIKDISLKFYKGEMVGIIGLNGAGKTTLLKILAGLINPSYGKVEVLGCNPWHKKNDFLRKIGMVSGQRNQLWIDLPAVDSFRVEKAIYGIDDSQFEYSLKILIELFNVGHLLNIPVRKLSLGEKMKFEIINTLLHNPELLLLDEPTIGLDIFSQKAMREFLKKYNEKTKCTTIITSHNMKDIESICNHLVIIRNGEVTYEGNINEINSKYTKKVIFKTVNNDIKFNEYGLVKLIEDKTILYVEDDKIENLMSFITKNNRKVDFSVQELDFDDKIEDYIKI